MARWGGTSHSAYFRDDHSIGGLGTHIQKTFEDKAALRIAGAGQAIKTWWMSSRGNTRRRPVRTWGRNLAMSKLLLDMATRQGQSVLGKQARASSLPAIFATFAARATASLQFRSHWQSSVRVDPEVNLRPITGADCGVGTGTLSTKVGWECLTAGVLPHHRPHPLVHRAAMMRFDECVGVKIKCDVSTHSQRNQWLKNRPMGVLRSGAVIG